MLLNIEDQVFSVSYRLGTAGQIIGGYRVLLTYGLKSTRQKIPKAEGS